MRRVDPQIERIAHDAAMHRRIGNPIDDADHLAGLEMQIAVHLMRVILECVLERLPRNRHLDHRPSLLAHTASRTPFIRST